MIADQPMSDEDLERLEDLLEAQSADRPGMNVEMLDGFFSALIVGPELVPLSEYLPHIFAGDPVWNSVDEGREALALMMRLWNHIVWRLDLDLEGNEGGSVPELLSALPFFGWPESADGSEKEEEEDAADVSPGDITVAEVFADVPEGFPLAALWSLGFLQGIRLRAAQWDAWMRGNEAIAESVAQILSLAQIDTDEALEPIEEVMKPLDRSERLAAIEALPFLLQTVSDLRMAEFIPEPMPRQTPVVRPATPGRNDPCPCGSGKKYKKCCGAPDALH